jgi:prepilin-type N-terminal cleavage/methylation domain-containing protein
MPGQIPAYGPGPTQRLIAAPALGFTLIELLIVVVILAMLAAVVVPLFAGARDDAELAALDATLVRLRGAIERYQHEHGDWHGRRASGGGGNCAAQTGGLPGTGGANSATALLEQLSRYTNDAGHACSKRGGAFVHGPYLRADALPRNPITQSAALDISTDGALDMSSTRTDGGWKYDTLSGRLIADHQDYDTR